MPTPVGAPGSQGPPACGGPPTAPPWTRRGSSPRQKVQAKVLAEIAPTAADLSPDELRDKVRSTVNEILEREDIGISPIERQRFVEEMLEDSLGYGPLEGAARRRQHHRDHVQHVRRDLDRAQGQDRAQRDRLHLAAPVPAHHRPHGARRRPPRRRVLAHGGRPAGRRLPDQRHRAAARPAGPGAHHPEVPRAGPGHAGPHQARLAHHGRRRVPRGPGAGQDQHDRGRRYRHREDHDAERPVQLHPRRRAPDHH